MKVVYVVRRFPKLSETFVLNEVREVLRQGDDVTIVSLAEPHADEPRHPGAEALASRTIVGPRGADRLRRLVAAGARVLVRRPRRAWPAFGWAVRAAVRERRTGHLKQFGEAAWLLPRIPADVDHVHAHFAHAPATVALLLARLTGRPFSFTAHANDIYTLTTPRLLRAKIAEARFVATVSDATRADVAETARRPTARRSSWCATASTGGDSLHARPGQKARPSCCASAVSSRRRASTRCSTPARASSAAAWTCASSSWVTVPCGRRWRRAPVHWAWPTA